MKLIYEDLNTNKFVDELQTAGILTGSETEPTLLNGQKYSIHNKDNQTIINLPNVSVTKNEVYEQLEEDSKEIPKLLETIITYKVKTTQVIQVEEIRNVIVDDEITGTEVVLVDKVVPAILDFDFDKWKEGIETLASEHDSTPYPEKEETIVLKKSEYDTLMANVTKVASIETELIKAKEDIVSIKMVDTLTKSL